MPATPIDAATSIANAIDKLADLLAKWLSGTEVRHLKAAAIWGREYMKRTEELFPTAASDKQLSKFKDNFERRLI